MSWGTDLWVRNVAAKSLLCGVAFFIKTRGGWCLKAPFGLSFSSMMTENTISDT